MNLNRSLYNANDSFFVSIATYSNSSVIASTIKRACVLEAPRKALDPLRNVILYCEADNQYSMGSYINSIGSNREVKLAKYVDSNNECKSIRIGIWKQIKEIDINNSCTIPYSTDYNALTRLDYVDVDVYKDQREKLTFTIDLILS